MTSKRNIKERFKEIEKKLLILIFNVKGVILNASLNQNITIYLWMKWIK